jgi:hypothetical protein
MHSPATPDRCVYSCAHIRNFLLNRYVKETKIEIRQMRCGNHDKNNVSVEKSICNTSRREWCDYFWIHACRNSGKRLEFLFIFFFQPITIVWKHPTARSRTFFVINFISLTALNPWSQQLGVLEGYIFVKLSEKSTTGNLDAGNWGRAYSYFVPPRDPLRVQRMFLRSKGSPVETPSSNGNHAKASAPLS